MKEFNEYVVRKMIMDMYVNDLATRNSLTLMDDIEFLKAFYKNMKIANLEHINDRHELYCNEILETKNN